MMLAVAAFVSLVRRRKAARIALAGVLAIWSFYLPAIAGAVRIKLTEQSLTLRVVRWVPAPHRLLTADGSEGSLPAPRLTDPEFTLLVQSGLTGKVTTFSLDKYGNGNKSSTAIVVLQRPVASPVELPEPDACTVVYIQEADDWRRFPPHAPVLKRTIRLEPSRNDPGQSLLTVELPDGARQGFGVWWPKSGPQEP